MLNTRINRKYWNGNKYVFNGLSDYNYSRQFGLYNGNYTLNIPIGHPIALLNVGKEDSISYTGDSDKKMSKTVDVDGNNYDFYYGNVTVNVHSDFGNISVYCFYHGYMGGENLLKYTQQCALSGIGYHPLFDNENETNFAQTKISFDSSGNTMSIYSNQMPSHQTENSVYVTYPASVDLGLEQNFVEGTNADTPIDVELVGSNTNLDI